MPTTNKNSKLILAKNILIDRAHKNVLNYSSSDMLTLLRSNGHLIGEASNYSFIQKGKISVGFTYEQSLTANYIAFQNPNYSTKWFFAFIDRVEYESNKSTIIYYTIDNWATWFDNLSFKPCYVIREHVNDDTIGAHTIDEGLAVPDVVMEYEFPIVDIGGTCLICVATNWDITGGYVDRQYQDPLTGQTVTIHTTDNSKGEGFNGAVLFNNNVFGQLLVFFPFNDEGIRQFEHFIYIANNQGHIEDVHDVYIVPSMLFGSGDLENVNIVYLKDPLGSLVDESNKVECGYQKISYTAPNRDNISFVNKTISRVSLYNFSDYACKNNKCYVYPYNYLMVSNNIGSQNIYKFENFSDVTGFDPGVIVFTIQLALSVGVSGRIVPVQYKKNHFNYDEALTLAKFPTCSWSADSYTNWLTDNAVNIGQRIVNTGANIVTGNLTGATAGIASLFGEFRKAQLLPEITGGQATGDVNFGNNNNNFRFMQYRVKTEYLKEIDDYFTRFGYKIVRVKTPNITGRTNFNYIEIGQGERFAYGEVPSESLNEINQIAQNGVTIWHNHANLGNYNITNTIVT